MAKFATPYYFACVSSSELPCRRIHEKIGNRNGKAQWHGRRRSLLHAGKLIKQSENIDMSYLFRHGTLLIAVGATLCCGSGIAGLTEGNDAFVKGDYVTALKELRPLAERGNAKAQYRLGRMYEFGQGVAVDKAQALVWLRQSATQGDSEAQLELGVIYATGDGVMSLLGIGATISAMRAQGV